MEIWECEVKKEENLKNDHSVVNSYYQRLFQL